MDKFLKEKFSFTSDFFENAINKNRLFHSYLLTGNDNIAKYAFALNIARVLNCDGDKNESCQCLNCRWIKNNSHPAVMTFSPLDFVHVNDTGKEKGNITVAQARFIKNELAKTSIYHRVLIITNAVEGDEAKNDYHKLISYNIKPPCKSGGEVSQERIWLPVSLKKDVFNTETANTLLKTIEEPFERVTFFFLVNSQEDLIDTIVSRCQIVNVPSFYSLNKDFSIVEKITNNFPAKENLVSIQMAEHVKSLSKEHGLSILEILELLECFYQQKLQGIILSSKKYRNIVTFLNKLEDAKIQLKRYVNIDSVLENLFFK